MPYEAWNEYGIVSKVFAYNSIPADAVKFTIKEVLKTQSPELLVVDARPFQYRDDIGIQEVYIRNFSDSIRYSWNRTDFLLNTVPRLNDGEADQFADYFFDIAKYHGLWKVVGKDSWKLALGETAETSAIKHGFQFIEKYAPVEEPHTESIESQTPVSEDANTVLQDLLDYCETINSKFLFVVSPLSETETQKKTYNYLESEITRRGFQFLDANDHIAAMELDYAHDFYNSNHVNIFGAQKYTSFLGGYIQEHYALPVRTNDPAYHAWKENYPRWRASVEDTAQKIESLIAAEVHSG